MARQRTTEILAPESIATAGTKILDLNTRDPISRISVQIKVRNVGWVPVGHPADVIKKIEVVDGSHVLFQMTGADAAALGFYKTKMQPGDILNYRDISDMRFTADIFFGRYLWDRELAVDPAQFNNLQLRVTHDKALGGNTPAAGTLRILADVFDEDPPTPIGHMLAKEQYRFTPVATTWYYIDLPTDYDISMLMVGLNDSTEAPNLNIGEIKLSQDQDKHVLLEMLGHDYVQYICPFFPVWTDRFYGQVDDSDYRDYWVASTYENRMGIIQNEDTNGTYVVRSTQGQVKPIMGEQANAFEAVCAGDLPFGMIPIPFGHQQDMDDYWKAIPGGSKRLDIKTHGNVDTSHTAKIIVEQKFLY
ncbi:unnamed protein product [marine sediment metagenome]|uniref:Uncharacterized protein n=1 Tax=marine sediment metagenome TaxID=412755 RepID=X1ALN7_9ZZZZ